ncbi:MAG: YibE/F family protein [Candidatus Andersenbacteria bacterium]
MQKILASIVVAAALFAPAVAGAQTDQKSVFYRGTVQSVEDVEPGSEAFSGATVQLLRVRLDEGPDRGKDVDVEALSTSDAKYTRTATGDRVVITYESGTDTYYLVNPYRLPSILWAVAVFAVLVLAFGRWREFTALLGLAFSALFIVAVFVPNVLAGRGPLVFGLLTSAVVLLVSLYLAHGLNRRTTVAVVGSFAALGIAALLAVAVVSFGKLFGLGSEAASYVSLGQLGFVDTRGLLLAGILIGAVGVLDDITIGQSAAVHGRLALASLRSPGESCSGVVRDSGVSTSPLVNTLFLAYAGVSLPLFLLFSSQKDQPLWAVLNGWQTAEEIARTLIGSSALVIAVPIATLLASVAATRWRRHVGA